MRRARWRRRVFAFLARVASVWAMKLTVSTLSCPAWDLAKIVECSVAHGIRGIDFRGLGQEIDITQLPQFDSHLDGTLSILREHGLSMPCLNTSVTLVSPSPERWEAMLDEAQRYARLASRTGTVLLRVFGGGVPKGMTCEEGRIMAQRHLRQIVKICKVYGCVPILETHDDWRTSSAVLELLHEFDPAEVGVLWDLEHPWRAGEVPADTAKGLRRFIRHVHVKDTMDVNGERRPTLLGEGILPLADCAAALREIGYDAWYCLESEKRWDPEAPEPEVGLPQFASYMRERWNR
jgi:sugar phosphate isomerase/epimerase